VASNPTIAKNKKNIRGLYNLIPYQLNLKIKKFEGIATKKKENKIYCTFEV